MGTPKQIVKEDRSMDPMAAAFIGDIGNRARDLIDRGVGTHLWSGPNVAPPNDTLQAGLNQAVTVAGRNHGLSALPFAAALDRMQNNGVTPGMSAPLSTLGDVASGAVGTEGVYRGLLDRTQYQNGDAVGGSAGIAGGAGAPTFSERVLAPMASGTGLNPYLKSMLEANDARIANRVNSSMSGMGRYGSGSHADVLARTLAESDNPVLASAFESGQNRALSAAQAIDNARRAADATALSAWGQAANIRQGDSAQGLSAAGGLNQNITNRVGAATASLDAQNAGAKNALGWAGLTPALSELQYDPAKRITAVGDVLQARQQAELDAQKALFGQAETMPWTQLGRYLGAVSPFNPVFSAATDSTKTTTTPFNWQQALNLGLTGAGLLFGGPAGMAGLSGPLGRGIGGGLVGSSAFGNAFNPNGPFGVGF